MFLRPILFGPTLYIGLILSVLPLLSWAEEGVLSPEMPRHKAPSVMPSSHIELVIENDHGRFDLSSYLYYLEDPNREYYIEAISDPLNETAFKHNTDKVLSFGYVDSVYWLKLKLFNATENTPGWLIEITGLGRSIDQVEIFYSR